MKFTNEIVQKLFAARKFQAAIEYAHHLPKLDSNQNLGVIIEKLIEANELDIAEDAAWKMKNLDGPIWILKVAKEHLKENDSEKASRVINASKLQYNHIWEDGTKMVLNYHISNGYLNSAKDCATLLGEELTKKNIAKIIKANIKKGHFAGAKEAAIEFGRNLSVNELLNLIKAKVDNNNIDNEIDEIAKLF